MARLKLLPGEREEVRLPIAAASYVPSYLAAASLGAWAAIFVAIFGTGWWQNVAPGPWYFFWTYLYGNAAVAYIFFVAAVAASGLLVGSTRRHPWLGVAVGGLGAVTISTGMVLLEISYERLHWALLALGLLAILLVELDRFDRRLIITNIRLAVAGGVLDRRLLQMRYQDVADLDIRQGPIGRLLDTGTLIPIPEKHAAAPPDQLPGIRPLAKVEDLVRLLVQHATTSEFLRQEQDVDRRLDAAFRALRVPLRR